LEIDENLNNYFNIFSDSPDNLRKDFGGAKPVQSNFDKNYFI